jgi:hypothetical protein
MTSLRVVFILAVCAAAVVSTATATPAPSPRRAAPAAPLLFDDFSYASPSAFQAHGWIVRSAPGWPGVAGATWGTRNVGFVLDPARAGNRLLRMTSKTDGTGSGTLETQVCQQRKFFAGTYATRVRFRDAPALGGDGDEVVETFYVISPLEAPLDPSYSELDWEYLPNGGWGFASPTLFVTSWATVRLDPWLADNTFATAARSLDGWHTLVMEVANGVVAYFLDGALLASHTGKYYPNVPMSLNYNLWFIEGGQLSAGDPRIYQEDVDWVFHRAGAVLTPQQVVAQVAKLRRAKVRFRDTVPPERPPLPSRCDF